MDGNRKASLTARQRELSHLRSLLVKHGICEGCGELYRHHGDEPLASCQCRTSEWVNLTPYMKVDLELSSIKNSAGRVSTDQGG